MFFLAALVGIYAYLILFLGLIGQLRRIIILGLTFVFLLLLILFFKPIKFKKFFSCLLTDKIALITFILLILQLGINLIGALGPELSFDALWYHLTLPKLYLEKQKIFFIPGGLLYYSAFPQLTEMLYTAALAIKGEVLAKLIHYCFGLGCIYSLFLLLKKFKTRLALIGCLIFYSQLAVGWLATSPYVDLARTFFEILALSSFLDWLKRREYKWLIKTAVLIGLAVSVKLLAVFSVLSFVFLILLFSAKEKVKNAFSFLFFSFLIPLPWFILTFINTKNPIYPLFTSWFFKAQSGGLGLVQWLKTRNLVSFIQVLVKTTFTRGDILTPMFLIGLPLLFLKYKKNKEIKIVSFYFWLNFLFYFLIPINYNRFLLPYIPAFIFILISVLDSLTKKQQLVKKIFYLATIFIASLNIISRGVANKKFLRVVLGKESKKEFLAEHLNFKVGNFYDLDGWFAQNIKKNDKVLVIGVHNLYYLDFPFDHISWAKKGTFYSHILVQNYPLPERFVKLSLVYQNTKSRVRVYYFAKRL